MGGTFTGSTSGTGTLAGSCGNSSGSPEKVFQWTPSVSGTATIQTCGSGTNYDSVVYVRNGSCASGAEVACNDDACANSTGAGVASRITPTVTAGQTYFIVVDGFGGAAGTFSLAVTPAAPCLLDVDGNGVAQVSTDVVYIARHLLGLTPVPPSFRVLDPTIPSDAVIGGRVDALCPP